MCSVAWPARWDRQAALGRALIAAHTLVAVSGGSFAPLPDTPDWALSVGG
jgi:hypothetical protein